MPKRGGPSRVRFVQVRAGNCRLQEQPLDLPGPAECNTRVFNELGEGFFADENNVEDGAQARQSYQEKGSRFVEGR